MPSHLNSVNTPDRLSLDSYADTNRPDGTTAGQGSGGYSSFNNNLNAAILNAKEVNLLRATIPNVKLQLPNYQLVFYYYELPTVSTTPTITHLKAVRLYPSDYVAPSGFTAFTKNVFFADPAALVTQLNLAAGAGGDDTTYNDLWVSGGVTFSYSTTTKQITWIGNTASKFYANVGWNDSVIQDSNDAQDIRINNFDGTTTTPQPYAAGFTLNQRIGFALSGTSKPPQSFGLSLNNKYAHLTGVPKATSATVPADSYPCLVYTQNIFLYSNLFGNSGFGNYGKKNLLGVVPVDVASFGVVQFFGLTAGGDACLNIPEIYSVSIEMRDDANQVYVLPASANVNLEIGFKYYSLDGSK